MTPNSTSVRGGIVILLVTALAAATSAYAEIDKNRTAEKAATASLTHPYAGMWKQGGCKDNYGLAIAPAEKALYSVSFCGPGGCFIPGTYRPNTPLVGDIDYRIIDKDTIEVRGTPGFAKYVRCAKK